MTITIVTNPTCGRIFISRFKLSISQSLETAIESMIMDTRLKIVFWRYLCLVSKLKQIREMKQVQLITNEQSLISMKSLWAKKYIEPRLKIGTIYQKSLITNWFLLRIKTARSRIVRVDKMIWAYTRQEFMINGLQCLSLFTLAISPAEVAVCTTLKTRSANISKRMSHLMLPTYLTLASYRSCYLWSASSFIIADN